jgi:hypothetical protein
VALIQLNVNSVLLEPALIERPDCAFDHLFYPATAMPKGSSLERYPEAAPKNLFLCKVLEMRNATRTFYSSPARYRAICNGDTAPEAERGQGGTSSVAASRMTLFNSVEMSTQRRMPVNSITTF